MTAVERRETLDITTQVLSELGCAGATPEINNITGNANLISGLIS